MDKNIRVDEFIANAKNKPKQAKTREARVEKCIQQILNGKGLND